VAGKSERSVPRTSGPAPPRLWRLAPDLSTLFTTVTCTAQSIGTVCRRVPVRLGRSWSMRLGSWIAHWRCAKRFRRRRNARLVLGHLVAGREGPSGRNAVASIMWLRLKSPVIGKWAIIAAQPCTLGQIRLFLVAKGLGCGPRAQVRLARRFAGFDADAALARRRAGGGVETRMGLFRQRQSGD
jgi:hypothetical protein